MAEVYQGASPNARFLAGALPQSDTSWKSYLLRSSWSVVIHVGGLALLIWIFTRPATIAGLAKVIEQPDITWIAQPGPGGGGGGGGTKTPEPPRKAEITPPKPRVVEAPKPKPEPPKPLPQTNIPAVTSVAELPGATTSVPEPTISQGAGTGGGGGTGTGTGVGSGTGSGYGEGFGGGTGGGAYREGNGVTSPRLIQRSQAELHRRGNARPHPGAGQDGSDRDARWVGRRRAGDPFARPAVRSRQGSDENSEAVAFRAGAAPRPAGAGADRNRDVLYAALVRSRLLARLSSIRKLST